MCTTCVLVGTSRVCFLSYRAEQNVHMRRETIAQFVIVIFHVVTCSTDAEPNDDSIVA